ncbi:hypothetical protein GUJ93_ZPchr0006g41930 [Zizania palustris]|uniref:RWP-RK domain-containing protein n=1 Tax=Zizania palustris TaxID=103762 RepID=A0A8J5T1G1_ZIZPA|nr:hypothetical protein GUJ93_ZPchr0006g41930 [Zizania palustris]
MRRWPPRPPVAARRRAAAAAPADELVVQHNRSLNALLRDGRYNAARRLFDALPARSVVTWNSFLAALARGHDVRAARDFFDAMPVRDAVSWNTLLAAYSGSPHPDHVAAARRLFDEMPQRDVVSWNTLLGLHARRGLMDEAQKLFDEMPQRNSTSWNTMVTGFFTAGQVKKALDLFDAMPVKDSASLSTLVSGFIKNGQLHEADLLLTKRLRVMNMDKAVDAYNTLIAAYGQAGRVTDARRLFDMIPKVQCQHNMLKRRVFERNVISWNSMMMCYIKAGDVCSARTLFDDMPVKDLFSWNTMISGYTQMSDMKEAERLFWEIPYPDPVSWNLIIQGFIQKGEANHARGFFDMMPERVTISWNTMISGYEKNGDYVSTVKLFSEMLQVGEVPDRHTFSSVLAACASLPMLRLGAQIHQLVEKSFVPDTAISNALITMYARCGTLNDAEAIFKHMHTQKDLVSWNALIGGYEHHGCATKALQLFKDMRRAKVRPTHITFVSLLSACVSAGLVSEGWMVFNTMVHEYGIVARVEHYAALVNLIGRNGQLDDALEVINSMPMAPDRYVWGSFLGACMAKKNAILAQMAAKELSKINPDSSAPYALCKLAVTQSKKLGDEFDAINDLVTYWEEMEQSENKRGEGEKGLPLLCSGEEKRATSKIMRGDDARSLTFELVSRYFYMPITQAARELNVGLTLLKKRCRQLGIPRWPHRKMKSLQALIDNVQALQEASKTNGEEQLRMLVETLQQERKLLEQKPCVELEEKTKRLRQACFKASYKKRRLLAPEAGEASASPSR